MIPQNSNIQFEKIINVEPQLVFLSFTNATNLQEWFCDFATVDPKPDGRFYAHWLTGFYVCGEYKKIEKDHFVEFSFFGKGYPTSTNVQVRLNDTNKGTRLVIDHTEIGSDEAWEIHREEIVKGWENSLSNLVSVLETGIDQRFVSKPMLGIVINDFNREIAQRMGVPVEKGLRLDSVVEEMGAGKAGLRTDDVIVRMNDNPVDSSASLNSFLQKFKAGDEIEVTFYRGSELKKTNLVLSKRPIREIPKTIHELANSLRNNIEKIKPEIDRFLDGITELEADHHPAMDEWSIKEIIAHLIQGERGTLNWINDLLGNHEAHYDQYPGNQIVLLKATIQIYPTLKELRAEYERTIEEVNAAISILPDEFLKRKGSYWRFAFALTESQYHLVSHLQQMRNAINSVRNN